MNSTTLPMRLWGGLYNRGGGVGILIRDTIKHEVIQSETYASFEMLELLVHCERGSIRMMNLYRPPGNHCSWATFKKEFSNMLSHAMLSSGSPLIVGDMNIPINKKNDHHTIEYKHLLDEFNMKQWVTQPTHVDGNTLDHICTLEEGGCLLNASIHVGNPGLLSDHALVQFQAGFKVKSTQKKLIKYRQWAKLSKPLFKDKLEHGVTTILASGNCQVEAINNLCTNIEYLG